MAEFSPHDPETEDLLRDKLVAEAQSRRAQLEIRSRDPLCGLPAPQDEKVAMILPLREGSDPFRRWGLGRRVRGSLKAHP